METVIVNVFIRGNNERYKLKKQIPFLVNEFSYNCIDKDYVYDNYMGYWKHNVLKENVMIEAKKVYLKVI